jgi:N-ethylmaleimide reductase
MSKATLYSTIKFGGGDLVAKNRIVLAPLTRARTGRSQVPNQASIEYYTQRSTAGIMITEGTIVSKQAMGWAGAAAIYNPEHVEGWKKVIKNVHDSEGIIFCQLWHMGRVAHSVFHGLQPMAASAIGAVGQVTGYDSVKYPFEVPRPMELHEVDEVLNEFRNAARNAKEAGFDGVEIHSANGYLFDTFLQSCSNQRTDRYGGSFENRFRLLKEVIQVIKESFPSERIGVRLSPNGAYGTMGSEDNFEAFMYYIAELDKENLAYVHVLDGVGRDLHKKCAMVTLADVRKVYHGLVIGNVGYLKESAEEAISSGSADLIAFGRSFIGNPDLPARLQNGWPLVEAPHNTWWSYPDFPEGDPSVGYTDFPVYAAQV